MSNDLLKEVQSVMKQRRMNIVALSKQTGIPKDRIYKWYQTGNNPKADDVELLRDWINGVNSTSTVKPESMDYKDKYIELLEKENKTKDDIIKANLTALVAGQSEATRYLIELSVGQVSTLVHLSVLMENAALSKHSSAERQNLDRQIAAKYVERTKTGNHEHKSGKA